MRLPRVRFSMGTLLFAVAVVAANCWAFRYFAEIMEWNGIRTVYRRLPDGVGLVPLVNFALISSFFSISRWIGSRFRNISPHSRPARPGFAYFYIQFAVLCDLVGVFAPEAMVVPDDIAEHVSAVWEAHVCEPDRTVPWMIFEGILLGLLISGPPLLLSWIGQVIASRAAAKLPRRRFRAMASLVAFGFISADLAVCVAPRPFEAELKVAVEFQVLDESSGRPIAGASVLMSDPWHSRSDPESTDPRGRTDAAGRARLTMSFPTIGQRNAFQVMGVSSTWGRWLELSAEGHRTRRIPLTEALGPFVDPARPGIHRVTLSRGETPEDSFRDIAGAYFMGAGMGGATFRIEADGRFSWAASGCTFFSQEFGTLKRHGEELELIPITHPGMETSPFMTLPYRVIDWGNRRYLSRADGHRIEAFCRAALTPQRSSSFDVYLRESDRDKPQTGLPRLPGRIWLRYLAEELDPASEDGGLRLAIDSVRPKASR